MIEVLVVVLIIAVLASIALPKYEFVIEKTRAAQGIMMLDRIAKAQHVYRAKRFQYAPSLDGLPLEIKDEQGNILKTSEFNDEYFDYIVFGTPRQASIAKRNNGQYELSVNYETNKIYCRPFEHKICRDFNFDEEGGYFGQKIWENCRGRLNPLFSTFGVTYDNEGITNICLISPDENNEAKTDFEFCVEGRKTFSTYRYKLSSSGISGTCYKGYFEGNKAVYTYCQELGECRDENKNGSIYETYDDHHIVTYCPKYDLESKTCIVSESKPAEIYWYNHSDMTADLQFIAKCSRFNEENDCVEYTCSYGTCSL